MTTADVSFWEDVEEYEERGSGRIRYGVHATLEAVADEMIFGSLRTITSREEKSDILTPWKEKNRISHETYNSTGFPEPSIRQGMFGRVLNRAKPYLNSRDGLARHAASQENSIAMNHFTGMGSGPDA